MSGSKSDYHKVIALEVGYSTSGSTNGQLAAGTVVAGLTLLEFAVPFPCKIGGIVARAEVAGTGSGNTVLDVQLNGTSIWTTAGNRPTLAAASTGEFANTVPNARAVRPLTPSMDRIRAFVATVPATTGHSRVSISIALESPDVFPNAVPASVRS